MSRLSAADRARLPDTAFAYVDSKGRRRLPIHDASHVRNALARFDQVGFESETARTRARERLLNAARRHGIVPIGFITGQLRSDRKHAAAGRVVIELAEVRSSEDLERQLRVALGDPSLAVFRWSDIRSGYVNAAGSPARLPPEAKTRTVTVLEGKAGPAVALVHNPAILADPDIAEAVLAAVRLVVERQRLDLEEQGASVDRGKLPGGFVTHLFTDIEGSTQLLTQLEDRYSVLLSEVRSVIRRAVAHAGGHEVEARADEFYAVFVEASAGIDAAVRLQRALGEREWPDGVAVRVRVGVHSGEIALTDEGYVGISVNTAARVSDAAHGGQILTTGATIAAVGESEVGFRSLGPVRLAGLPQAVELFQVEAEGLATDFPPPRIRIPSRDRASG